MADHSKPVITSTYANFVAELNARFDDLAIGLDPALVTPTGLPTNAIRWSSAARRWEKWDSAAWVVLSATYDLDISGGTIASTPISGSTGSFTTLAASGAFSLTGDQVQVTEGGTGSTTAAGARTNLGAAATVSPVFTGTPTAPTATAGTNTTQLATTAFVQAFDDAAKANIASPTFTGVPTAPTATAGTNTTQLATTAFVQAFDDAAKANLASPTFTGVPAAPTASTGTNTTQLATTAFVQAATPDSSATVAGLVELATTAEAETGTDTTRAVTPAGLAAAFAGDLNFYTGAVTTNLAFPVGSILIVSGISGVARNAVKAIYFYPSEEAYGFAVNGSPLTGTWRSRGFSSGAALMQRTA